MCRIWRRRHITVDHTTTALRHHERQTGSQPAAKFASNSSFLVFRISENRIETLSLEGARRNPRTGQKSFVVPWCRGGCNPDADVPGSGDPGTTEGAETPASHSGLLCRGS